MIVQIYSAERTPQQALQSLIARHGRWPIARALLITCLWPERRLRLTVENRLSDHLLRDIGLPPTGNPPTYLDY